VLVQALSGLAAPARCIPGTSSVCASLKMPRFHFRRGGVSVSWADMAGPVVLLAVAAGGCSFRVMGGSRNAGGQAQLEEMVEQRIENQVQVGEVGVLIAVTSRTRWCWSGRIAPSRGRRCIRARPTYPCTGQTQGTDDKRWALHVHQRMRRCRHQVKARGTMSVHEVCHGVGRGRSMLCISRLSLATAL
jgi:hypothetical protein